jgi:hypothetical protein
MTERDHEEHDGCLCGCDHSEHELTPDIDLPAAVGGVQGDAKPRKPRRKKEQG